MNSDLLNLKIKEVKRHIGINSYRAASGALNSIQISQLTTQEMKGALFLIRMKNMEQLRSEDIVNPVTKYTIGG